MLFNTLSFLIFFVAVFGVYWALPSGGRWILLLIASYFFYACWNPAYLLLLFGASAVTFFITKQMTRSQKHRKFWLVLVMVLCFGALGYFKYFNFFAQSAFGLLSFMGLNLSTPFFNILLPVGISFQTFQNVGYAIDVYRGTCPVQNKFFRYALFSSYFPQLVAGPIERANNLMPQLEAGHQFSYQETAYGLRLMLVGFFKKIAIADTLAVFVDVVYDNPIDGGFTGWTLIVATVLFAFQIYCDFSGYSDIAVGVSKVFGIDLMINFKSPYLSRNVQEFWRRWHISLSTWFQDYVYIPLGGSRVKISRHVLNLLITFTISGLWHGASWTFLIWGVFHGVCNCCFLIMRRLQKYRATRKTKMTSKSQEALSVSCSASASEPVVISKSFLTRARRALVTSVQVIGTFVIVDIGWIMFRAGDIAEMQYIFSHLFTGLSFDVATIKTALASMGFTWQSLIAVFLLLLALFLIDAINYRQDIGSFISKQRIGVRWAIYVVTSFALIAAFMFTSESQNFIYFQF